MSAAQVSEKLGVYVKSLYRWRDEYRKDGQHALPGKLGIYPKDNRLPVLAEQLSARIVPSSADTMDIIAYKGRGKKWKGTQQHGL